MTPAQRKVLETQRDQRTGEGLARFPVLSREADRPLGRKAILAAAPLEGIDLARESDPGRKVDL